MRLFLFVLPALLAALVSLLLTPLARRIALRVGAVDLPSSRKIHREPIPRLGGLAVITAIIVAIGSLIFLETPHNQTLLREGGFLLGLALGVIPVLAISLWDDIRPLRPAPKLLAQTCGALIAVSFGIRLGPQVHMFGTNLEIGALAVPISILWIVGLTNAFNLVDGLDGLSAGLAFISAVSLAGVSALVGLYGMASGSLILAGALLGFLPYNVYPAKVFLGDTGSTAIGFFLACLALRGGSTLTAGLAVLLPMVVMGLPVAEALISMLRRAVRQAGTVGGGGIFDADREHIHHRLLALGFDHRRAVLTLYGVGVALALCGFASLFINHQGAAILLLTLLIAAFIGVKRLGYDEFALVRRGVVLKAYDAPVLKAALFSVFVDVAMIATAIYAAIVMKYDDWSLTQQRPLAEFLLTVFPLLTLTVFYLFRLYRGSWRQATIEDFLQSTWAVLTASAIGGVICLVALDDVPRITFFMLYSLILLALVNGVRASYRLFHHWTHRAGNGGEPVLIYGAGRAGSLAVRELLSNSSIGMRPLGFIDDDPHKIGKYVNGYPVFSSLERVEELLKKQEISGILIAAESLDPDKFLNVLELCTTHGLWLRRFRIDIQPVERVTSIPRLARTAEASVAEEIDDLEIAPVVSAAEARRWSGRLLRDDEANRQPPPTDPERGLGVGLAGDLKRRP